MPYWTTVYLILLGICSLPELSQGSKVIKKTGIFLQSIFPRSLADFSSKMDTIQSDYERVLKSQGIEPPFLPEPYRGSGFILINAPKPNYGTDLFEGPEKSPKPESYKNLLRIMKYSKQAASKKVVDEGSIKTLAEALASLDLPTVSKERLKHSYPRILVSQLL